MLSMKTSILSGTILVAAALALPLAARQDVALKDLMPKGMVIGLAVNQRQFEGADATAVDIITKQFNQISPENVLKFQPTHPAADRYTFDAADRTSTGIDRHMQVVSTRSPDRRSLVFQARTASPRSRHAARAHARTHPHRRRALQRQDPRLGCRQRSD
jgi:hypothetical protein